MCGIFGYIGNRTNAPKIVFEGLKQLEYRGYDSWGVAVKVESRKSRRRQGFGGQAKSKVNDSLVVEKHVGKIGNAHFSLSTSHSSLALGHTRWATHGRVTGANAHPHLDCSGKIAVVHNGIVENYLELKGKLSKKHKFKSETDTEVIAHLIEEALATQPLKKAVRGTFLKLSGLNALVVLAQNSLLAAKNGSPLVIGLGRGDYLIASDAAALAPHSRRVIFLRDNQLAVLNQGLSIEDLKSGKKIKLKIEKLSWEVQSAQLGKYKHFMLKEIYEQPQVLRHIAENSTEQIRQLCRMIRAAHGVFLIGAGTAFHACLAGTYLFSKIAKQHVNTVVASEFNYLEDFLTKGSLVIALSQSGETIDVVEPLKRAKEKGAKIVAIVNNVGSTIWQMADFKLPLGAGPEMAVASTKAYVAKLAILLLLAYGLAGKLNDGRKLLNEAAIEVERLLFEENEVFKKIAKVLLKHNHVFTIGRGLSYQSALESALKMKEVSYVYTEGLAGGELKHGPIALISQGTPCIVFAPMDETYGPIISNATEIKARGGLIIGVSPVNHSVFDSWVQVRDLSVASIIPNVIPAQLFGYFLAVEKGLDPDRPRNLAKSVTVK